MDRKPFVFNFDIIDDTPPARFTETGDVVYNDPGFKSDTEEEKQKKANEK